VLKEEEEKGRKFHSLIISIGRDLSNCKIMLNSNPEFTASLGLSLSAKKDMEGADQIPSA
jgi:hypothetical protein